MEDMTQSDLVYFVFYRMNRGTLTSEDMKQASVKTEKEYQVC